MGRSRWKPRKMGAIGLPSGVLLKSCMLPRAQYVLLLWSIAITPPVAVMQQSCHVNQIGQRLCVIAIVPPQPHALTWLHCMQASCRRRSPVFPQSTQAYAETLAAAAPKAHLLAYPGQQVRLLAPGLCVCLGPCLGPHIYEALRHLQGPQTIVLALQHAVEMEHSCNNTGNQKDSALHHPPGWQE